MPPPPLTFPLDCFVGLAVGKSEVAVDGYVRQPATMAPLAGSASTTIANTSPLQWSAATLPWGIIDRVMFWDAVTGGSALGSALVDEPLIVRQYEVVRIPVGGIAVTYGQTNRPWGVQGFGTYGYQTYLGFLPVAVTLVHGWAALPPCSAGAWAAAGSCGVGAWTGVDACATGVWTPGPFAKAA